MTHGLPANALYGDFTRLIFDFFEEKDEKMDIKTKMNYTEAIVGSWMKPMNDKFIWTHENTAKLKEAWEEGDMSASEIANKIFKGRISRLAVVGKAHRMGMKRYFSWKEEDSELLRKAWEEGNLSGSEIAKIVFKGRVSTAAIHGQVRRMGLPPRNPVRRKRRITQSPRIGTVLPAVRAEKIEAPQTDGTPLLELKSFQCVFPIADADEKAEIPMLFCGYKRWDKSSYCKYHHKVCHLPLPPKKRYSNFRLWR